MVRVANLGGDARDKDSKGGTGNGPARTNAPGSANAAPRPASHAGDALVIEEHVRLLVNAHDCRQWHWDRRWLEPSFRRD